jgi:hypothetical protein
MNEPQKLKWKLDDKKGMTGTAINHRWVYGISPRKDRTYMLALIPLTGGTTEHIICNTTSKAIDLAEKHYQSILSEQSKE